MKEGTSAKAGEGWMRTESGTGKKPLGVYVHIPFCVRKCLYCDFLSAPASGERIEHYVNLLLREMQASADMGQLQNYEAATVYLGGGTPSLLTARQLDLILCKLGTLLPFRADAEISMEMNPGTVTRQQLADIRSIGINRISIGVQSLQDDELAALGRIHRAAEVYHLWEWTEPLEFRSRSLDLMSGIPGQTKESLRATLKRAVSLAPEHLSVYSLIVEEGTSFYEQYPDGAVDEDTDRRLYALTKVFLQAHGYERYEISSYARDGHACRHNLTYWMRGDYLGFGLGAASLMKEVRFRNAAGMTQYEEDIAARETCGGESVRQQGVDSVPEGARQQGEDSVPEGARQAKACPVFPYAEREALSVEDRMAETMFLGLRMTKGVSEQAFRGQFGYDMQEIYGNVLKKHMKDGLLAHENGFFHLTERGLDVSNYVMADFLL